METTGKPSHGELEKCVVQGKGIFLLPSLFPSQEEALLVSAWEQLTGSELTKS